MAEPFLAEIRIFSFDYAPKGWALCNGQLLPINQNQALFALLGTTFGGDGESVFALPNQKGKAPVHFGQSFTLGQTGGEQAHTLTTAEMPTHTHVLQGASEGGDAPLAAGNLLGAAAGLYGPAQSLTSLVPGTVSNTGGSQPHENMQPYLTLNFCIALQGIFPSQS